MQILTTCWLNLWQGLTSLNVNFSNIWKAVAKRSPSFCLTNYNYNAGILIYIPALSLCVRERERDSERERAREETQDSGLHRWLLHLGWGYVWRHETPQVFAAASSRGVCSQRWIRHIRLRSNRKANVRTSTDLPNINLFTNIFNFFPVLKCLLSYHQLGPLDFLF